MADGALSLSHDSRVAVESPLYLPRLQGELSSRNLRALHNRVRPVFDDGICCLCGRDERFHDTASKEKHGFERE
jgi:hypothetical protein